LNPAKRADTVTWTEMIYDIIPPAQLFVKYYYNIDLWVNTSVFAEKAADVSHVVNVNALLFMELQPEHVSAASQTEQPSLLVL
jgi:hypothetical protein